MHPDTPAEIARYRMVRDQLRRRGISDPRVLEVMGRLPRERFVHTVTPAEAYADRALPIDCGQTISQPCIVALMSEALRLAGSETVLEIGTGSGYQTAILAELAHRVVSIEVHPRLSQRAGRVLDELGYQNVRLVVGDGCRGWPDDAPYDRILVAAAAARIPQPLVDQLAEGGILVIPVGSPGRQTLQRLVKRGGVLRADDLTACRFVPLVGAEAHSARPATE